MKILTLLRHAKAVEPGRVDDHERRLSDRGRREAEALGRRAQPPELVLCSDSARTRETFDHVAAAWTRKPSVSYERGLYLVDSPRLLARLHAADDSAETLWLIGHNPGLHDLAQHLAAGAAGHDRFGELSERFPTCARAIFTLEAESWGELGTAPLTLTDFDLPR